jgi:hypothetical protein
MSDMKKLNGCYRARVENNGLEKNFEGKDLVQDPEGRLRVQVRVLGVHTFNSGDKQLIDQPDNNDDDIIPLKHLPWAEQCTGLFVNPNVTISSDGTMSGAGGVFTVPAVGAWVWVFFEQGDPMSPIYFGGMLNYQQANNASVNIFPDRTTIVTKAGHQITVDDSVDKDGNPDGFIAVKFISVLGSISETDMSIISLRTDRITLKAKNIELSASETLSLQGLKSAKLNTYPIVTSLATAPKIESLNMGQ